MNEVTITSDSFVPIEIAMIQLDEEIEKAIYSFDESSYKTDHIHLYMCPLIVRQFMQITFKHQKYESLDLYRGIRVLPGYELNTVIIAHKDGALLNIPYYKIKLITA